MQEITFTSNQIMIYTLAMIPIAMSCVYAGYMVGLKVGTNRTPYLLDDGCQEPMIAYSLSDTHRIQRYMFGDKCKTVVCGYLKDKKNCSILEEKKLKNSKCVYL